MKPIIILVAPQMGENIGAVARAMKNFAVGELRLVKPRDGWPNEKAIALAAGATDILHKTKVYDDLSAAIADLTYLYATTAVKRDLNIKFTEIGCLEDAFSTLLAPTKQHRVGIMFGRESCGLMNEEIALANEAIYIATNPTFSSLNIAQAVLIVCYHLFNVEAELKPFINTATEGNTQVLATKLQLEVFFNHLFVELNAKRFFRTSRNQQHMILAIKNIFNKVENITANEVQILHGIIRALSKNS